MPDERERQISVVKELYQAFGEGNLEKLLGLLAEDVVFILPALPGVPLKTEYRGREGFAQFLKDREPALVYNMFTPR